MISKLFSSQAKNFHSVMKAEFAKAAKRVAITGAAGQIGYSLLFRIASGQMLGADQPVILQLIDLPQAQNVLKGVKMEIDDCAFPLVQDIICTDSLSTGFKDTDYALLVGAKPRGPGMERADLLKDNGKIFIAQGKAIADNSNRNIKVIVVGNPTNTNCLILANHAKGIPQENFSAMTRLDHNRGIYQLSQKLKVPLSKIRNFSIWGNHSPTMVPLLSATKVNGKDAFSQVEEEWVSKWFNPKVGKRGAEIIEARKLSSAASAANSAIEHIRDWALGADDWVSMGVHSDGSYGIPKGLVYSFPCTVKGDGTYKIVKDVKITPYYQKLLDKTTKELLDERKAVESLLK